MRFSATGRPVLTRHFWFHLFLVLCALTPSTSAIAQSDSPVAQPNRIYIPTIFNQTVGCQLNQQEAELSLLFSKDSNQKRNSPTCNPTLAAVARARAVDMASRNYFNHTNPDGYGPNFLVEAAGYGLPSYYSQSLDGNNVESITSAHTTPQAAWADLSTSPGHKSHVLGEIKFYAEQIEYGIGYAYREGSQFGHYWVIITAKAEK